MPSASNRQNALAAGDGCALLPAYAPLRARLQLPARSKEVDPFTLDEANLIIAELYKHPHWPSQIYAAKGNSPNRRSSSRLGRMGSMSSRRRTCTISGACPQRFGDQISPPYNCRHTYATICLMSGLNPAFIAQQLGHSVQMLLSTYARWLNSSSDWSELEKLKIGIKSVSA